MSLWSEHFSYCQLTLSAMGDILEDDGNVLPPSTRNECEMFPLQQTGTWRTKLVVKPSQQKAFYGAIVSIILRTNVWSVWRCGNGGIKFQRAFNNKTIQQRVMVSIEWIVQKFLKSSIIYFGQKDGATSLELPTNDDHPSERVLP